MRFHLIKRIARRRSARHLNGRCRENAIRLKLYHVNHKFYLKLCKWNFYRFCCEYADIKLWTCCPRNRNANGENEWNGKATNGMKEELQKRSWTRENVMRFISAKRTFWYLNLNCGWHICYTYCANSRSYRRWHTEFMWKSRNCQHECKFPSFRVFECFAASDMDLHM